MKKTVILSLICIAITTTLSGCNNPKAANKENFAKALSQHVAKNPYRLPSRLSYCSPIYIGQVPNEFAFDRASIDKKYEALKNAGILTFDSREEERPYQGRVTITKYDLSEKGKQIAKERRGWDGSTGSGVFDLPYCQVAFKEVKLFTEPSDSPAGKISIVNYTFAVEKVDDWVNHPEILQAYPQVKEAMDSIGKPIDAEQGFILTSEGWSTGEK